MNAPGVRMARSTCDSAAKFSTARGRWVRSRRATRAWSAMSPCTSWCRGSPHRLSRLPACPAYVSLSRFTMGSSVCSSHRRTKLDPMKPAPPVTRILMMTRRQVYKGRRLGLHARMAARPEHSAGALRAIEVAGQHEHQVRQAVQVLAYRRVQLLDAAQGDHGALGAAGHGARQVRQRRGTASARQYELAQRRQGAVVMGQAFIQEGQLAGLDGRVAGNA